MTDEHQGIEHQLICTLALNPELISTINLVSDDFREPRLGKVFKETTTLISQAITPDILLLADTMGQEWLPLLSTIFDSVNVPDNLGAYVRIIKDARRKRDLLAAGETFSEQVQSNNLSATSILLETVRKIESVASVEVQHVVDLVADVFDELDDIANGKAGVGLQTHIARLDQLTGGLQPGDLDIIAARTSVGKTAFLCNLAYNIDAPCLIISGEQAANQITKRLLALIGSVSAHRLKIGNLSQGDIENLAKASTTLSESKIFIADKPRPSIDEIERLSRSMHHKVGIKAVFIDYLQLVQNNAYKEKRLQIADISSRCKALARELNIPVVVLAQLNRGAEDHKPRLSDLKESGSIEEDADHVILLSRGERDDRLMIDLQKNRHGATGYFEAIWDASFMRVRDAA